MEEIRERMLNHNRQKSKATAEATETYFKDIITEMRVNQRETKQRRGATISKGMKNTLIDEEMKEDMLKRHSHQVGAPPGRLTEFEARRLTDVEDDVEDPENERKHSLPDPLSKIELPKSIDKVDAGDSPEPEETALQMAAEASSSSYEEEKKEEESP